MKKLMSIMMAFGLLVSAATAQTVKNVTVTNSTFLTSNVCVAVVTAKPTIVTEYYVKDGTELVLPLNAKQARYFACMDMPCMSELTEVWEIGLFKENGITYRGWMLPVFNPDAEDITTQYVQFTQDGKVNRVFGVPSNFPIKSSKTYQMLNTRKNMAVVVNTKGAVTDIFYNVTPGKKYPKNTTVFVCSPAK